MCVYVHVRVSKFSRSSVFSLCFSLDGSTFADKPPRWVQGADRRARCAPPSGWCTSLKMEVTLVGAVVVPGARRAPNVEINAPNRTFPESLKVVYKVVFRVI